MGIIAYLGFSAHAHADQLDPLDAEGILALRSISQRCAERIGDAARILESRNEVLYAEERKLSEVPAVGAAQADRGATVSYPGAPFGGALRHLPRFLRPWENWLQKDTGTCGPFDAASAASPTVYSGLEQKEPDPREP